VDQWAAVVLAGGRAQRLGGLDKPALTVAGQTLLDRVLAACAGAEPVVVVGPKRPTEQDVRWAREEPPHAGPLAAVVAGLHAVPAEVPLTAVLAADLPWLRTETLHRLRAAVSVQVVDGAVLVDAAGQPQWLCGVWRTAPLRTALQAVGEPTNQSVRGVLAGLSRAEVPARRGEATDVDTPEDLRRVDLQG
jgi:molybdopterin-guanine dinucleotide biosynthesis protein A